MNRSAALVLCILFFLIFFTITYWGAQVTLFSSLAFSTFVAVSLLLLMYPLSQVFLEPTDMSLFLYALFITLGLIVIAVYFVITCLSDTRKTAQKIGGSENECEFRGEPGIDGFGPCY